MPRGGDTSAKARANGKKAGRPAKLKVEQKAEKSIAVAVLAMDGPPSDHFRVCECDTCRKCEKLCRCDQPEYKDKRLICEACTTAKEHSVCHCEICRWWQHRLSKDSRIRYDADVYLTNRRDGKPAESVISEGRLEIIVTERSGSGDK